MIGNQRLPGWWRGTYDEAWDRVKETIRSEWNASKRDLGGHTPAYHWGSGGGAAQLLETRFIPHPGNAEFDEIEPAYRYGYAARMEYGDFFDAWNDELAALLKKDWEATSSQDRKSWEFYRRIIRAGWMQHDYEW